MSMKKNIRRAFRSATPDILSRITDEKPVQEEQGILLNNVPARRLMPRWVSEVLSTAAIFALLFGICGGAIWFARNSYSGTEQTPNVTLSTGDVFIEPVETVSTDLDIINRSKYEGYIAYAASLVYSDETAVPYDSIDLMEDGDALTVIIYEEYTYIFLFDTLIDKLVDVDVFLGDCIYGTYIAQGVAEQIALTDLQAMTDANLTLTGFALVENSSGFTARTTYYFSFFSSYNGLIPINSYSYGIDACTGEILSFNCYNSPTYDNTSDSDETLAVKHAADLFGLDVEDPNLTVSVTTPDIAVSAFIVEIYDGQTVYSCCITPESGQVFGSPETYLLADAVISEAEAIKIATSLGGYTEGSFLFAHLKYAPFEQSIYTVEFYSIYAEDGLYQVTIDAFSGEILFVNEKLFAFPEGGGSTDVTTPPDGNLGTSSAISSALDRMGYSSSEAVVLSCEFTDGAEYDYYLVHFLAGGCEYTVAVNAYSGEYLWHTGEDHYDLMIELQELFAPQCYWYNMALTSTYASPEKIDLSRLFYNGYGMVYTPTAEEWDAIMAVPGFSEELDLYVLTKPMMSEALETYFGITLEDVDLSQADGLVYVEFTDCYYLMHSDYLCTEDLQAVGVERVDGNHIRLYYTANGSSQLYAVTLYKENGYTVVSNLPVTPLN